MLDYQITPVQELHDPLLTRMRVRLLVKREDLNHPKVSGNKWWKLKYNLEQAHRDGFATLLTYGGAFSNHIFATAAAAHAGGFNSIGIIRGEETLPLNPVLSFARAQGMDLHYISREAYRNKNTDTELALTRSRFGNPYIIPEGGSNELAVRGVAEFVTTLGTDFDYLCCAVGTGATLAGLVRGLGGQRKILGFPVLKVSGFEHEVERFEPGFNNWTLIHDYHEGGYAKTSPSLNAFINTFSNTHHIPLEHVYTGKLFNGVVDMITNGYFKPDSRILVVHSGGVR